MHPQHPEPVPLARPKRLWRYTTGIKGVSRVSVYERRDGASLYIEWWDTDGRHQESLRSFTGQPVTDRDLAMEIADDVAVAQERKRNAIASGVWRGYSPQRTVGELLDSMHAERGPGWSDTYTKDQDRFRAFWTGRLGAGAKLVSVTPMLVERAVRVVGEDRGWSARTRQSYLRYIVDAFAFAQTKLKWLNESQNLSAVTIPKPRGRAGSYTLVECRRLMPALEDVDPVAGWIGHVLFQTGRRLTATRTLRKSDVTPGEDRTLIRWPEETDKAGQEGESVVAEDAHRLTVQLMASKGPYVVGSEPPSLDTCRRWIEEAEKRAGIRHVKKRAWHGIKRRYAELTEGMPGRDKQSGTRNDTLSRVYHPDDDRPGKAAIAEVLAQMLDGA